MSDFQDTLHSFAERFSGTLSYPVDVEALAVSLGVRVRRMWSKERSHPQLLTDGLKTEVLLKGPYLEHVGLSKRERFSVAHELGHYIIWKTHRYIPSGGGDYWDHEVLCDRFAGRILVPSLAVRRVISIIGNDSRNWLGITDTLGREARVSSQAAAFRVSEETGRVFYFSAARSENSKGATIWRVTSSTLDSGKSQRIGVRAHIGLNSPEGEWFEQLRDSSLESKAMDFRLQTAAVRGGLLVAHRVANQIRFCIVSPGHIEPGTETLSAEGRAS